MKLWFWIKLTITAFALFALAAVLIPKASPQTLLPLQVKTCRTQYTVFVEQLTTAAVAIDSLSQRQAVVDLAAAAEHSYDLIASDPAHSVAAVCAADRLAKLDAVITRLKEEGYLPDPEIAGAAQAKLSGELLAENLDHFWAVFRRSSSSTSATGVLDRKTANDQKRPTSPRTNPGVQPYP